MVDVADSNAVYYYHFDGLGSVAALSDVNNVIVERYSYDVFGAPTIYDVNSSEISQSAIGNPYMFTARRVDNETSLYYYRARIYNPIIGRFLQIDPIGYIGGLNLYTYCGNNPRNWIDPWGLLAKVTTKNDELVIEIPIVYTGSSATKELIEKFNSGIESTWSGKFGNMKVTTKVVEPEKGEPTNIVEITEGKGRAYVEGNIKGVWPSGSTTGWAAAHEAGHFMGLKDRYDYVTGKPHKYYETDIMGVYGGTVRKYTIMWVMLREIERRLDEKEIQKSPENIKKGCKS